MNDFNPFETLWIDPNQDRPKTAPIDGATERNDVMWTMWQFNPFKTLWINPNEGTDYNVVQKNWKDMEVSSMLWIQDFEPMTDNEKQSYVDALSDEDWNTWNQLKSEWYSFEARKALMENQDMLYDINTPGSWKYMQTQETPTEDKMQSFLDWYQNNIQGFSDKYKEWSNQNINYENKGIWIDNRQETENTAWKKIANVLNSVVYIWVDLLEHIVDYSMHKALELYNKGWSIQDPNFKPVSWDATNEGYKSSVADLIWIGVDLLQWYVAVANPATYLTLWVISQDDWIMSKILNGANDLIEELPKWLINQPAMQEYLSKPWNEWMEEDIINGVTFGIYALLGWWLKKSGKVWGKTKAWIQFQKIRNNVARWVQESIKEGKAAWERAKDYNIWENIQWTRIWRSNVRKATIQWMKEWFRKGYNAKSPQWLTDTRITPVTETTVPEEKVNNTEIINRETQELPGEEIPVTEETPKTIKTVENNSELNKLAKETKLSENTITNLESNPDLQTEFQNTIKPYLEENWKNNPEWVITEPVNSLVYDIRSWIDELRTQQANLNRSINNQKLSPMEKALIKEIEKIIDQKEPKQILKSLGKLTPAQQWLMKRIVPNLDSRIQTINQVLELTKEITKWNLLSRFLKFQAERPRKGITWFAKQMLYWFVKDLYDQRWIQTSTEAIDKFIDWLSDEQISAIQKKEIWWKLSDSEKKSLSDILDSIKQEGEPVWTRQLKEGEYDQRKRDSLEDQWYTPKTRLVTVDKDGKIVRHDTSVELEMKPFTSDKPLREIFKEAWVNLTLTPERIFNIKYARDDVDWVYVWDYDLMEVPSRSISVWILAHEFGHRVMAQLTENEKLKIINTIKQGEYNMTDAAAEERFAEYFRNYFLYGNINGKTALEVFTTAAWQKAWQRIVNIMEKTKRDLFADLWAKSEYDMYQKTKSIDKMIDNIYKLTEKWKEIINRTPEKGSRAEATKAAAQTYWRLEEFSKTDIINEDLTEIKNATNELKNIHVNEDWYVVWDFHSHETPVYGYIEDSNLPQELKDFLKKQEIKYLEEQDKTILERLNNLNGD